MPMYCWVCHHRAGYENEGARIDFLGKGIDWGLFTGGEEKRGDGDVVMSIDEEEQHQLPEENHKKRRIDRPALVSNNSLAWLVEKTNRLTLDEPRRVGSGTRKRFCDTSGDEEVEDMLKGEGLVEGRPVKRICVRRKRYGYREGRRRARRKRLLRKREMAGMREDFGLGGF